MQSVRVDDRYFRPLVETEVQLTLNGSTSQKIGVVNGTAVFDDGFYAERHFFSATGEETNWARYGWYDWIALSWPPGVMRTMTPVQQVGSN
jgi:hypothetical protein